LRVSASIYDLGSGAFNAIAASISANNGLYHVGIEVADVEWSYGYCESGSGVFAVAPGGSSLGQLHETVFLGETQADVPRILHILHEMARTWIGPEYSITSKNCITFSKAFLARLSPSLHLPAYAGSMSDFAESMVGRGPSSVPQIDDTLLVSAREKKQMWREAERIMRDFSDPHEYSTLPTVLHARNGSLNIPLRYNESTILCYRRIGQRKYQHISGYLKAPGTRRLFSTAIGS
jgi:hypothetical protein